MGILGRVQRSLRRRRPAAEPALGTWQAAPGGGRLLHARCNVCGGEGTFRLPAGAAARESLVCPSCGTTSRYRSIARGLLRAVSELAGVTAGSLRELAATTSAARLRVYDTQAPFAYDNCAYPIPSDLAAVPWVEVETSMWRPQLPPGARLGDACTNQNLEALTYPDASFDVVVTSDVMEHVRLEARAHREIRRVLRPGGVYLFTVPSVRWRYDDVVRVRITDEADPRRDEALLPREYHGDPNDVADQALVYRVYGSSLDERLSELGFAVSFTMDDVPAAAIVGAELFYCRLPGERPSAPTATRRRVAPGSARATGGGAAAGAASQPSREFADGHFYSPVVDIAEAQRDRARIWPPSPAALSVDLRLDHHRALLEGAFLELLADYDYPPAAAPGAPADAYHEGNGFFEWLDSKLLFAMLRHLRPRRMIEVGSGFSSLLAADVNRRFLAGAMGLTCIDPSPLPVLRAGVRGVSRVVERRVQDVPLAEFAALAAGDVLFVDSSHVAKTGSDVNHIVFEILPRLQRGVFVHFHDVFLPHDYPPDWVLERGRSWNEEYVVRALLMDSTAFEVYFSAMAAFDNFPALVERATRRPPTGGGSLWIRRRP